MSPAASLRAALPRYLHALPELLLASAIAVAAPASQAQRGPAGAVESRLAESRLTMEKNGLHVEVSALRDDVLRLRYWQGNTPPEDASWAVLPAARMSVAAIRFDTAHHGLTTSLLHAEVDPNNLTVTILDKAGKVLQQDAAPLKFDGSNFTFSRAMPLDAHYFGLGDKTGSFDRREGSFTLWNTDAYAWQESTDPLYKAIPFFMTYRAGLATGTLLDNTWRSRFDFGRATPNVLQMGAAAGPVDSYFLYGPAPKQVLAVYAWLTGPTPLPPLWSFGFQQSRFSYTPQARVEEVAKRLRTDAIPADAIYLDIDYQDRFRPFTINAQTFPDMPGMVRRLHDLNLHVVAITDLHIAKAPSQNYLPYDNGLAQDRFVHNADGSIFSGKVWPGESVFPDFTQQQTRAWWGALYTDFVRMGIDGFWNDMNEPSVFNSLKTMPDNVHHRIDEPGFRSRTATHAEIHNVYGMENARATEEGLLALQPGERPFVLTRAAYAGTQRYAATWTGDNSASWNHLRLSTFMLKNLGLSGFSMAGADVGGYAGTPSAELLTKWIEISAFQPIDRDHAEKGTGDHEPWANGPEQEAIRRRFIEERYRLLPYIYTAAEEASRTGTPILRPLFLEFPDALPDRHPMDIDPDSTNEFLFGPDLLVAPPPILEQRAAYDVHLPSDGWYDFWSGNRVKYTSANANQAGVQPEGTKQAKIWATHVTPAAGELAVFVRPGTILPYAPLTQSTQQRPEGMLTLKVFPGADCKGSLYQDDGHTFAYQHDQSLKVSYTCQQGPDGSLQLHLGAHMGAYKAWWSTIQLEVYGRGDSAAKVSRNGSTISSDKTGGMVRFTVPDDGQPMDLLIR